MNVAQINRQRSSKDWPYSEATMRLLVQSGRHAVNAKTAPARCGGQ